MLVRVIVKSGNNIVLVSAGGCAVGVNVAAIAVLVGEDCCDGQIKQLIRVRGALCSMAKKHFISRQRAAAIGHKVQPQPHSYQTRRHQSSTQNQGV